MVKLLTSAHTLSKSAVLVGDSHPDERVSITVKLKPKITPDEVKELVEHLENHDIGVTQVNNDWLTVHANGSVQALEAAFGVKLQNYSFAHGTFRHFDGHVSIPDSLDGKITAVLGLNTGFRAKSHHRKRNASAAAVQSDGYYPNQVAEIYSFPTGDGTGQSVGIIELGGGYVVSDLNAYNANLKLPNPIIHSILIGAGSNNPSDVDSSGEVCLDIEVIAAIAPKATIVVYFAGNTDQDFSNAIAAAVHDKIYHNRVVSISWGGPESSWAQQSIDAFEQDFAAAVYKGVNVYVAAGDDGSSDGTGSSTADYPASSPYVIGCGGTEFKSTSDPLSDEVVWNDQSEGEGAGGGGFSSMFKAPSYQQKLIKQKGWVGGMRGVPDVTGDASPNSGYAISVNGDMQGIGGTSAVAPLFAALNLLLNQAAGKSVGWLNPVFYAYPSAFNDITSGNNGSYKAAVGWDAASGLGSPNGINILGIV
jgi:kumamolisin